MKACKELMESQKTEKVKFNNREEFKILKTLILVYIFNFPTISAFHKSGNKDLL